MVDTNTLERQLADESLRIVGPARPVDDAAIFTAITTSESPKWRFQSMFSATKFVVAGAIVALFGGFLLTGVLTQPSDEMAPAAATTSGPGTFSPAGSLAQERDGHTATLLPDGRVLVVGGEYPDEEGGSIALHAAPAEVWDPTTAAFSPAGSLIEARSGHTATLLPDGRVLIVGGYAYDDCDTYCLHQIADAEVWDPETESFGPAGSLVEAGCCHAATLLPDGRVLIVGGVDEFGKPLSAEVWDPETASFDAADGFDELASAEVWDPEIGAFVPAGSFAFAYAHDDSDIAGYTVTRLPDGDFLVAGGEYITDVGGADEREEVAATATVWDPETASFDSAGSLDEGREGHTATFLPDGRVLVVGGRGGWDNEFGVRASAEVWDPETASFGPAGSLAEGRSNHTATPLPDGRVLIVGGSGADNILASAELWTRSDREPPSSERTTSSSSIPDILPGVDLVTEEVEAGVERIVGDGIRDLSVRRRRDLAMTPDGAVWLYTSPLIIDEAPSEDATLVRLGEPDSYAEGVGQWPRLTVSPDGTLWTPGGVGLRRFDGQGWSEVRLPPGMSVYAWDFASDGTVWAGGGGARVARLDASGWQEHPIDLDIERLVDYSGELAYAGGGGPPPSIRDLAVDTNGHVWTALSVGDFAAAPMVLLHFDGETWSLVDPLGAGKYANVDLLDVGPDGTMWVYLETGFPPGTERPYLARLADDRWTVFSEEDGVVKLVWLGDSLGHLRVDQDGAVWAAPQDPAASGPPWRQGVRVFDGTTWRQYLDGHEVMDLEIAPDGRVWVLTRGDVYVITPEAVAG